MEPDQLTSLPPETRELLNKRFGDSLSDRSAPGVAKLDLGWRDRRERLERKRRYERADGERKVFPRVEAPGVVVAGREFDLTIGIAPATMAGVAGEAFPVPREPFTLGVQVSADGFQLAPGHSWRQELSVTEEQPFPSVTLRAAAEPRDGKVRASNIQVIYEVGGSVVGFGILPVAVVSSPELLSGVDAEPERENTVVSVARGEPGSRSNRDYYVRGYARSTAMDLSVAAHYTNF